MKLQVAVNGETETVDVSILGLTLAQQVRVQRLIGNDEWDELMGDDEEKRIRPSALQAIIYAQLKDRHPDIDPDDVEVDWSVEPEELDPTETG